MRSISALYLILSCLALVGSACSASAQKLPKHLEGVKRFVFLGDSITWAGGFIEEVELALAVAYPESRIEIINLGLPSETVSGLTEPNHAGGAFPRPDLHERLDRVLEKAKPDLVVACYGMNDGIYHPLAQDRFKAFQDGIRKLRTKVLSTRANLWILTPATFDALPIKASTLPAGRDTYPSGQPFEGYDDVLTAYSRWLKTLPRNFTTVTDIHSALRSHSDKQRKKDPSFTFAPDGVHPTEVGHRLIAAELLRAWNLPTDAAQKVSPNVRKLIHERHVLLRDAWLADVGHKRPGMPKGLPLEEATKTAADITARIKALAAMRLGSD